MKITCLSLNTLFEQIRNGEHEDSFLILISSFARIPEIEELRLNKQRFAEFHFIDDVDGDYCISKAEAHRILDILDRCSDNDIDVVVSCDGGISRSAAIAGFAEVFFCGKNSVTSKIWNNPTKTPNELVLATLLCEFGSMHGIDDAFLRKTTELIRCIGANAVAYDRENLMPL